MKVLKSLPDRCTGCMRCELACSYEQTGTFQLQGKEAGRKGIGDKAGERGFGDHGELGRGRQAGTHQGSAR